VSTNPDPRFFRINESPGYPFGRAEDKAPTRVVVVPDLRAAQAFWVTQEARAQGKLAPLPPDPSRN
jgi:hypothetical protein